MHTLGSAGAQPSLTQIARKTPGSGELRAAITLVRKRGEVGADFCPLGSSSTQIKESDQVVSPLRNTLFSSYSMRPIDNGRQDVAKNRAQWTEVLGNQRH